VAARRIALPQPDRPGHPLGRLINHDPRSLSFLVAPPPAGTVPTTVFWARRIPLLHQGEPAPGIGSCTASAALGVLGSDPYHDTLPADLQARLADPIAAQEFAVELYAEATVVDDIAGTYPPEDCGSSALAIGKVLHRRGLIGGYRHITSRAAAEAAIGFGPFLVGTVWTPGMDSPDPGGVVDPTGRVVGGHEYECFGREPGRDLWWFTQTWGPGWGVTPPSGWEGARGAFALTTASMSGLLAQSGDATQLLPAGAPELPS
jgi:hypothetical protein